MIVTTRRPEAEEGIARLAAAVLRGRRLVMASNRGPVEYRRDEDGRPRAHRGSGGLVTALSSLARHVRLSWVASAISDGDRAVALSPRRELPAADEQARGVRLRFVVHPPEQYELYYNVFANPFLWFLQHNLHDLLPGGDFGPALARAWRDGYRPVNRAFAEAVLDELARDDVAPVVMLHDYQLYLAAGFIRERAPATLLHQFIHIPWPEPASWRALPDFFLRAICRGLLANDVVGLQTRRDVANFLATCAGALPEASVDATGAEVRYAGRTTHVRAYPVSVDVAALRELRDSPRVLGYERRLRSLCGEQTIVRVDRLDPSKNVHTGFLAFRRLLERRPDLRGRLKFLAFLVPTRTGVAGYRRYAQSVFDLIAGINQTYGHDGWRPIEVFYEDNAEQAIAGMRLYDVLMVNSALDGMNLVSKEGPIVNARDGVLVLSRGAGSYEELASGALGVAPCDVEGTAAALAAALAMPPHERRLRALGLRLAIESHDVTAWLRDQLADLHAVASLAAGRRSPLSPAA